MDVLSCRILIRPSDPEGSHRFYRDTLGLAVAREFGEGDHRGLVFFAGNGFVEVSGRGDAGDRVGVALWLQVRDVRREVARLESLGQRIIREPRVEPWGLEEAWIEDPDGIPIVLVRIPDEHPLRRDSRRL